MEDKPRKRRGGTAEATKRVLLAFLPLALAKGGMN